MIKILKYLLAEAELDKTPVYLNWFIDNLSVHDFKGVEQLMYLFLNHCHELGVVPARKYIDYYLKIRGKQDIMTYSIPTDGEGTQFYDITNIDSAFSILGQNLYTLYETALLEDTSDDFKFVADLYFSEIKKEKMTEMFTKFYPMLQSGQPTDDILESMASEIDSISSTYDSDTIRDMDFMENSVEDSKNDRYNFIAPAGLPCINGDAGGQFTKKITTVNGQPKGGKTRFTLTQLVYPVLIHGDDVLFYETELPKMAVKNILIAYHIVQLYKGEIKISDSIMNNADKMSEDQERIYEAAKYDLFESGKYGKFIVRDCDKIPVEKLKKDITTTVRADNKIKTVVIDYVGDLESDYDLAHRKVKSQWEIITEAYKVAKKVVRPLDINMIMVNQFNDEGEAAALKGNEIMSGMCQGGRVVQRSTDYELNITYTEEQMAAERRCISTGYTSRSTKGFRRVPLQVEMEVSIFTQIGDD